MDDGFKKPYITDKRRLDPESAKQVLEKVSKLNKQRKRSQTIAQKHSNELWDYIYDHINYFPYHSFANILDCSIQYIRQTMITVHERKQEESESDE